MVTPTVAPTATLGIINSNISGASTEGIVRLTVPIPVVPTGIIVRVPMDNKGPLVCHSTSCSLP